MFRSPLNLHLTENGQILLDIRWTVFFWPQNFRFWDKLIFAILTLAGDVAHNSKISELCDDTQNLVVVKIWAEQRWKWQGFSLAIYVASEVWEGRDFDVGKTKPNSSDEVRHPAYSSQWCRHGWLRFQGAWCTIDDMEQETIDAYANINQCPMLGRGGLFSSHCASWEGGTCGNE